MVGCCKAGQGKGTRDEQAGRWVRIGGRPVWMEGSTIVFGWTELISRSSSVALSPVVCVEVVSSIYLLGGSCRFRPREAFKGSKSSGRLEGTKDEGLTRSSEVLSTEAFAVA